MPIIKPVYIFALFTHRLMDVRWLHCLPEGKTPDSFLGISLLQQVILPWLDKMPIKSDTNMYSRQHQCGNSSSFNQISILLFSSTAKTYQFADRKSTQDPICKELQLSSDTVYAHLLFLCHMQIAFMHLRVMGIWHMYWAHSS